MSGFDDDVVPVVVALQLGLQVPRLLQFGECSHLQGVVQPFGNGGEVVPAGIHDVYANRRCPRPDHAHGAGGGIGEVDDTVLDERAAVVDQHGHGLAVGEVGDLHAGAQRESLVRGGHAILVVDGAAGGLLPVEAGAVP